MSGHSKWHSIRHKKAIVDAKRGKIFTKVIREITVAAKEGGGDIEGNPRLRLVVQKAKGVNMPWENIDRAIKKGTGELEGVSYEEVIYEGYGGGGVALVIEVLTDNRNRSVSGIRRILSRFGGSLGEGGSVLWMFEKKGEIILGGNEDEEEVMELVIDEGVLDIFKRGGELWIRTSVEGFEGVKRKLEGSGKRVEFGGMVWVAKDLLELEGEGKEKVMDLIEELGDHEDVQSVWSNVWV